MNRRRLLQGLSFSMLAAKLSGASSVLRSKQRYRSRNRRGPLGQRSRQVGSLGPEAAGRNWCGNCCARRAWRLPHSATYMSRASRR